MNLLLAASRQSHPESEWCMGGSRFLCEQSFKTPINWALYDQNPDLLHFDGYNTTHRPKLRSNSFHHQSLITFDGILLSNGSQWSGGPMELLFGVLEKTNLPLYAFGLNQNSPHFSLNQLERKCFTQKETHISVLDENTQMFFKNYGVHTTVLPCPSLFACPEEILATPLESTHHLGIFLEDTYYSLTHTEEHIKLLYEFLNTQSRATIGFCWTIEDYLRFSKLLKERLFYSFEAKDYFKKINSCHCIITPRITTAIVANGMGKPALYLENTSNFDSLLAHYPFIKRCKFEDLSENFGAWSSGLAPPSEIFEWKAKVRRRWAEFLETPIIASFS